MFKRSLCPVLALIFVVSFTLVGFADEVSDLKAQLATMQRQIRAQGKLISAMQKKIEGMGVSKPAQTTGVPEGIDERVTALEKSQKDGLLSLKGERW